MDNQLFTDKCKEIVVDYANEHLDKSDNKQISNDDVFVV